MVPRVDMTGTRTGKLTVLYAAESSGSGLARWWCRCDCGELQIKFGSDLRRGSAVRCRACAGPVISEAMRRHGETGTVLHELWLNMKGRCRPENTHQSRKYADRGIAVFPPWAGSYELFRDYVLKELGSRPDDNHSLDRIDNDRGYEPGNIQWASRSQQLSNRTSWKRQANRQTKGQGKKAETIHPESAA